METGPREKQWLVLEYCPYGDLRTFLQNKRDAYDVNKRTHVDLSYKMGPADLVLFALQVARGMEFLTLRKVIIIYKEYIRKYD